MIPDENLPAALSALHAILIRARYMAYEAGHKPLGDLLDDAELIPELLAADEDKTDEFRMMLESIAMKNPAFTGLLPAFDESVGASAAM